MTEWKKEGALLSFSYGWQEPAKTELWVYETLLNKKPYSQFVEFVSFPWATLIDLIDKRQIERASFYINALKKIPPKNTLVRATACQHIKPEIIFDFLEKISITDLYWAHKCNKNKWNSKIRLHALPLYPVAYFNSTSKVKKSLYDRKYIYAFVGAYDSAGYLSNIREKIFELPMGESSIVIKRDNWHFESHVYKEDILGVKLNQSEIEKILNNAIDYSNILSETIYSLCPSGSGPNTIRFWESLAFGCIPVLLSDDWARPDFLDKELYIDIKEENLDSFILSLDNKKNDRSFQNETSEIDFESWLIDITKNLFDIHKLQKLID